MTDPRMRDAEQNFHYYATNEGYEPNADRLREPRSLWAADRLKRAGSVLDVGANDAWFAGMLPESVAYYGVELNPKAVAHAVPRAVGRVRLANACTVDYGDWNVQAVVCMELLEHVPDPLALLRAFKAALVRHPNPFLVTTSPVGRGEAHEPGNNDHLREWTTPEFIGLHERAGYGVVEVATLEVYRGRFTTGVVAVPVRSPPARRGA